MDVLVLGPLALSNGAGAIELTGAQRRRLLAALVVRANTVVPADQLIDILWGDTAPPAAARNLHNQVWRVRAALGQSGGAALVTQPPGYLLRVDPERIDAVRFERLVTAATAAAEHDPERAAGELNSALALWRGPAYAEFADEEFCRYEVMRLEEARLAAIEARFAARLAAGHAPEVIGELEAFVATHPLRESPRALLMTALHRAGRQAEALDVYRDYRQGLADQLGLEPSPALREHHQLVVRGDAAEPVARRRIGNLRAELSELVGRAGDVARTLDTMTRRRVLTLTGVGGVGKTRLALRVAAEAADRFPHGVWVCELSAVRDGGLVPDVVATTLGMQEPRGLSVTAGLVDFLRSRHALLVIDNCEHVLPAAAHLIDAIAGGCPAVTVLATSREPLEVDGEQVLPVLPLAVPDRDDPRAIDQIAAVPAVELFVERAGAAAPAFTLGPDNVDAVSEICRRLDGLPLAIELAATRLRSMSVQEIARRLERRLRFLRGSGPHRDERHSALGTMIDWSYQLLEPAARSVFDQLSVLVGTFTLADAVAIAGAEDHDADTADTADTVADAVASLVHKSMLVADTTGPTTQFAMLETLRLYGREQLRRAGRLDAALRRHAGHCAAAAEASVAGVIGPDEARAADRVTGMLDDLRGAHGWALRHEPATAVRISAALLRFTSAHGPSELYTWADRAVAAWPGAGPPDPRLAAALAVAAAGATRRGDLAGAVELAERGLALVPRDPARRFPLWVLARVASYGGRFEEAADTYAMVAELAMRAGDAQCAAYVTASAALQHAYRGEPARAAELAEDAGRLASGTGNPTATAWADYALGVALKDTRPWPALAALERAYDTGRAGRNTYIPGVALSVAAGLLTDRGELAAAAALAAEVVGYWSHESHWAQQWVALRTAIDLLSRLGEDEAAATLCGAYRASRTAIPAVGAEAERLTENLATLRATLGTTRFATATARGTTMSDDDAVALAQSALARVSGVEPGASGSPFQRVSRWPHLRPVVAGCLP